MGLNINISFNNIYIYIYLFKLYLCYQLTVMKNNFIAVINSIDMQYCEQWPLNNLI